MTEREGYELREMAAQLRQSWERTTSGVWASGRASTYGRYQVHAGVRVATGMQWYDAEFVELVHGLLPRLLRLLEAPP